MDDFNNELNNNENNFQNENVENNAENQSSNQADIISIQTAETKPLDPLEKVTIYYNQKQEKQRPMAVVLMALSLVSFISTIAVGVWFSLILLLQVFKIDASGLFAKDLNALTLGLTGLAGFLAYFIYFIAFIIVLSVVIVLCSVFLKLYKNTKATRFQPYHITAYNGTMISSVFYYLFASVVLALISFLAFKGKTAGVLPILIYVLFAICVITMILLVVELIVARTKYNKYPDQETKNAIKDEANARFKLFIKKDGHARQRAKQRKRWF